MAGVEALLLLAVARQTVILQVGASPITISPVRGAVLCNQSGRLWCSGGSTRLRRGIAASSRLMLGRAGPAGALTEVARVMAHGRETEKSQIPAARLVDAKCRVHWRTLTALGNGVLRGCGEEGERPRDAGALRCCERDDSRGTTALQAASAGLPR
ncbi:hypothetical protein HBH52_199350 [Parastagonospora nodorum]|nr:hypothetical protein HBH52_199350 [Parastagonospora nodorum]